MDNTMNKELRKPDLNAPRCRANVHKIICRIKNSQSKDYTHSFLKEFREEYPQYKNITNDQAMDILELFHGKLWNHSLNNRDGVELPKSLGYIFLGTCASARKPSVDYGALIKDNIKKKHLNFESDNKLAKIFYTNFSTKYKFRNREIWYFTATREFKRAVPEVYRANWKTYVEVESGRNISKYINRMMKNNYFKRYQENYEVPSSYNEFDLS
jgi:hypothetical protein